jgi:hypothetical protein
MGLTMSKEKEGKSKDAKPGFTTFRIYEADGEDLSDLASLEGETAADVYQKHCAPVIRKLLKTRMEERLRKLNNG